MPRQIIDTESSRPAYRRRLAARWVIVLLLVLIAMVAGVQVWRVTRPRIATGALTDPGKVGSIRKPGPPVPQRVLRRKYAA